MEPIRIAHISDLHFGAEGQKDAWNTLTKFLQTINPDLILATGDIVDSPKPKTYKSAREDIDNLCQGITSRPNYYVCAGNHDRHIRGNALGKLFSHPILYIGDSNASISKVNHSCQDTRYARSAVLSSLACQNSHRNPGQLNKTCVYVFPKIPKFFIVTSVDMVGEKAADVILADA